MKPWLKFNVGISNPDQTIKEEAEKIELAIEQGVEFISQISIEKSKIHEMWDLVSTYKTEKTKFASVPLYESVMFGEPLMETVERQYDKGVRNFVFHCTPRCMIESAIKSGRNFVINSRAGLFLVEYFQKHHNKENPCLDNWDNIVKFAKRKGDCSINVSGALRPGHISLSDDAFYLDEIEYFKSNHLLDGNVLECGGHIKYENLQKFASTIKGCNVSLMGPLITEATNKYDHITNILGQTLVATTCNSIVGLLVLSPAEHLHLPNLEEDKDALIYAKMCQHYIGLIYKDKGSEDLEKLFRTQPDSCSNKANLFGKITDLEQCNMCGEFCPLRKIDKNFRRQFKIQKN